MFIDEVDIKIKAGDGGRGVVSWRREKFVPRGGPDGGDGGKGGDVIFTADRGQTTLLNFRFKKEFPAENGGQGMGANCHGKNGADLLLKVPPGTILKDIETGETVCDLVEDGQVFVAGKGGIGGRGNAFFKSATMQAPKFAQPGMPGDEQSLHLELRLLADVGIIGLPNAGKSTLISRLTAAKPTIADYPFTTLSPKIGVVQVDEGSFVMADMPGLIAGASAGKGLGIKFLKHIERTAVLCHLIEIGDADPDRVLRDFETVENELRSFDPTLLDKKRFVAITKIDTMGDREESDALVRMLEGKGLEALAISGATGENLTPLVRRLGALVKDARGLAQEGVKSEAEQASA
jgi:GTP-binding protein